MGDITKNLSRHEFACKCGCGSDTVDFELALKLQECVDEFNAREPEKDVRIEINSGTRCMYHNAKVGGTPETAGKPGSGSQHLYGRGADFYLYDKVTNKKLDNNKVADYLEDKYPGQYGIGRYIGRTHFDTRTKGPARWDRR